MDLSKRILRNPLCRVCLSMEEEMTNLFNQKSILQMLQELINIQVFETAELPEYICEVCKSELVIASKFKNQWIRSNNIIKSDFPYLFSGKKRNMLDSNKSDDISIEYIQEPRNEIDLKKVMHADKVNVFIKPFKTKLSKKREGKQKKNYSKKMCTPEVISQHNTFNFHKSDAIGLYDDEQFELNYHMTKEAYFYFFERMKEVATIKNSHRPVGLVHRQLLAVLSILTTNDTYDEISKRFCLKRASLIKGYYRILRDVGRFKTKIVKWPQPKEIKQLKRKFFLGYGFENVIGIIGATSIPLSITREDAAPFINKNSYISATLQVVCDYDMKFLDCAIAEAQLDCDQILEKSSLVKNIVADQDMFFPDNEKILGNLSYKLRNWLITPIENSFGRLSENEEYFNKKHYECSSTLVKAFALLFGRFPRLQKLTVKNLDTIPNLLRAACVVHNICLMFDENNRSIYEKIGISHIEQHLIIENKKNLGFDGEIETERKVMADWMWNLRYTSRE